MRGSPPSGPGEHPSFHRCRSFPGASHACTLYLCAALGLTACGSPDRSGREPARDRPDGRAGVGFPLRLEDATGAVLILPRPPARIVSLVPSGTLILQSLGAQDLLVGRSDFDTDTALVHLPSVGGGQSPSMERLISLDPDLVILFAGESDPSTPARLSDLGIPVFSIRPDGVADVQQIIRQLGAVTGREGAADTLLKEMNETLAEVHGRVRDLRLVRVAYLLGGSPPWVAGGGTFIDELLTAAGGENVFADLGSLYAPVSPEELLVRRIDLLLAPVGAELRLPDLGIPLQRVSPDLELPGPGLAQRALELAALLHPEGFR